MIEQDRTPGLNPFDALLPREMAGRAELLGERKVGLALPQLWTLAFLAGVFISLGAAFATTVGIGNADQLSFGVSRLLVGTAFSLGLVLVVVGGAELFTGNNLIVMAWCNRKVTTWSLLRNWAIVYTGNFAGAVATAAMLFVSEQYLMGNHEVGRMALTIAARKCELSFLSAVVLGILCNVLVCLAVWMSLSARSTTDKILCIVPPITAFVACGFEHSIANMYFVPVAIFIKWYAPVTFWSAIQQSPADFPELTWLQFVTTNLLPVTLGNIVGGAVLVGIVYWFVYLRPDRV
ncbi:MAG: formate/nitrite family transporter [Planctomycetota bacterium]|nr:formate/nitrite family transporter [Planctomycetota bacterium]